MSIAFFNHRGDDAGPTLIFQVVGQSWDGVPAVGLRREAPNGEIEKPSDQLQTYAPSYEMLAIALNAILYAELNDPIRQLTVVITESVRKLPRDMHH